MIRSFKKAGKKGLSAIFFLLIFVIAIVALDIFLWGGKGRLTMLVSWGCGLTPRYYRAGTTVLFSNGTPFRVKVYKRAGAPYLLVGPYRFLPEQSDFFFVTNNVVVGRVLDDKTMDWKEIAGDLFIYFDLSSGTDSMAPCYYFHADIKRNTETGIVQYNIHPNPKAGWKEHIVFSIPVSLLKSDSVHRSEVK